MSARNTTYEASWYIITTDEQVGKLLADMAIRFRFYPPVSIFRIEPNELIKFESLHIRIGESISVDQRDAMLSYIAGWLDCAGLASSTNPNHSNPTT